MTDRSKPNLSAPPGDVFPATQMTWLGAQVQAGDEDGAARERARGHVMSVYFEPLVIYVRGSSFQSVGDAEELVAGFFSDRLSRADYLTKWLASGLPLRAWLIGGIKFYCKERIRAARRDAAEPVPEDAHDEDAAGPGSDYRKQIARNLVREAMRSTGEALEGEGMGEHWQVFRRHHLEGVSFAQIAMSKGISEERAAVMSRTAARRLRARLRDLCAWPGASNEEIDREILSLFD